MVSRRKTFLLLSLYLYLLYLFSSFVMAGKKQCLEVSRFSGEDKQAEVTGPLSYLSSLLVGQTQINIRFPVWDVVTLRPTECGT
jgi:hypothetical protein